MAKRLSQVEIGGVDVTQYCLDWERVDNFGDATPQIELTFSSNLADAVTLGADLTLDVYEGFVTDTDKLIINGYVESYKQSGIKNQITVIGRNNFADAIRREVTHVYDKSVVNDPAYPDGKISAIVNDILTTYANLRTNTNYGAATSTSANKLVDSTKAFSTSTTRAVAIGYIVHNTTDNTTTTVTAVDSDTQLSLAADIMVSGEAYHIYPSTGAIIQDSGTSAILSKFVCNHADPLERLKKLQETLGWILYYDDNTDLTYFEPKNYSTNATTLTVGSNVINIPQWTTSKDQMINDLTLEGAVINEPRAETFSGDASEVTFTLTTSDVPNHIEVYYGNATNLATTAPTQDQQKVGVPEGTTIGTFDFTFDLKNKSFTFTSFVPSANANNILARYWVETPSPVHRTNAASITAYGRYKKTIPLSDVLNVDDAEKRCDYILNKFASPFLTGKLTAFVTDTTWRVGQSVNVVDTISNPNISDLFTIIKIVKKWPGNFDEFTIGDKQWMPSEWQTNMLERLKRLEETLIGDTAVVNEIVDNEVAFNIWPDSQTIQMERLNDTFALGISPNDILYDADETQILDNFVDNATWSSVGAITLAKATANSSQSVSGDYLTSTAAIQFTSTEGGAFELRNTSSFGDLRKILAMTALTGTPQQGTLDVWLRTTQTANFTSTVQLEFGDDASNFCTYNSQTYALKVMTDTTTWNLDNTGDPVTPWTLLMFDANVPASVTGTPAWTTVSYAKLKGTVSGATTFNLDYFNVSKNDTIGLNGLGDRKTVGYYLTTTY